MHPADNNIAKLSDCIDYQIDQFEGDNTDWKLCVLVMKKAVPSRNCYSKSFGFFLWVLSALQPYVIYNYLHSRRSSFSSL